MSDISVKLRDAWLEESDEVDSPDFKITLSDSIPHLEQEDAVGVSEPDFRVTLSDTPEIEQEEQQAQPEQTPDIKVTLGDSGQSPEVPMQPEKPKEEVFKIKLKARKTLDGNIMISDHPDIDIVIMPNKMKIITFARDHFDDMVYEAQNRLFKFLFKKGVIIADSVSGGNVYCSMEAKIQKPESAIPIDDIMLLIVGKFIESERPSFKYQEALEDERTEELTDPDDEESTELGKVPVASEKGSIPIHQVRRYAYGL